tara:strand:+ start:408 stop:2402 length:1995 start_codon:yes stop_codon:yes gene_type:complete
MSGFGYNVLGFGANASGGGAVLPSDDQFNRVSFLSHFDGANNGVNNAFDDGSANNYTVTAAGDVTQGSFGPFARPDGEWGVDFDGASDYLDANDGPTFGTDAFTIEFFVNHRAITGNHIMFDSRPTSTNGLYPMIWINSSGTLQYYVSTSSVISGGTMTTNTWHHVAVSRTSTSTKMFLDGTQVGSTYSDSNNYVDSGRMRVGTSAFQVSDGFHVNGVISNLRVVNSALYTSNFTAPTTKLTAVTNTKLLTCQSNRFVDNSADGLTMTPSGNTAVTAFGPFLSNAVYDATVNGASAYFDGSGDYLSTPSISIGTGTFSFECWLYPIGITDGNNDTIIRFANGNNNTGVQIYIANGDDLKIYKYSGGAKSFYNVFLPNQWHKLLFVRESNTLTSYVNGVSVGTYTVSDNLDGVVMLGANGGAELATGYMSGARLSNNARQSGNYTVETAPFTTDNNTTFLLNMADGQAIDSAAQNNLTLFGTAKTSTGQAKFGDASLLLDGNSDYVRLNTGFNMAGGDFTFEMFVRLNAIDVGQTLFDTRPDSTNGLYHQLYIHSGNRILYVVSGAAKIDAAANTLNLTTGTWYHIALCRSGTSTKLFLDGTQKGSTYSDSTVYLNSGKCVIGVSSYGDSGNWGNYYMNDFRASNFARYTSNFTAPTEPFADKGQ